MVWRDLPRIARDLAAVNASFIRHPASRAQLRSVVSRSSGPTALAAAEATELRTAPATALPYEGLSTSSLTLAGIHVDVDAPRHLVVAIGEIRESSIFAGIHTALTMANALATRLGVPLRIVMLDVTSPGNSDTVAQRFVVENLGIAGAEVVARENLRSVSFSPDDYWLATHYKTAHAIDVATVAGLVNRDRVVYLIQDYEPGFSPWSTESVVAQSTYHAGFIPLVNSLPLRYYLQRAESIEIEDELVFAPQFELDRLRRTAEARSPQGATRVLFYSRRTKHRNLYALGLSALRAAAIELPAEVEFVSAGEPHSPIDLGNGRVLTSLGRLAWQDYFDYLATVDVVLSLQQSPHPSHPPLDAAISGALAVTNNFDGSRDTLHPRLIAVAAETAMLAGALVKAVNSDTSSTSREYLPVAEGLLGGSIDNALNAVVARLSASAKSSRSD